jgi:DNA-binding response OmpR family regulator
MENPGRVLTAEWLLNEVWRDQPRRHPRILTENVTRVRAKLSAVGAAPDLVRTVRGAGYVFDVVEPVRSHR